MIHLRRLFSALLIAGTLGIPAFAQFGIPTHVDHGIQPADIREQVGKYCRMDYLGGRLTEQDWAKMKPLVSWQSNPDFPLIDVVSRYEVDNNVASEHGKWYVTVHYHVIGRFDMGQGYSTEVAGSVQDAQLVVSDSNGELKVVDANPNYPHPSRAAMLKWLQDKQAAQQDPKTKVIYEQAVKDLSAQSGSPFAK